MTATSEDAMTYDDRPRIPRRCQACGMFWFVYFVLIVMTASWFVGTVLEWVQKL